MIYELTCIMSLENILGIPADIFHVLTGKHPECIPFEIMKDVWEISSRLISKMYRRSTKKHAEYEKVGAP